MSSYSAGPVLGEFEPIDSGCVSVCDYVSVCLLCFSCVFFHCISVDPQILNFPCSHFSLNSRDHNSRKWSGPRLGAAGRAVLPGWLKWNGFAMVTAGKEVPWRAVESGELIKRPRETLSGNLLPL